MTRLQESFCAVFSKLPREANLVAAVSGGADSTALLAAAAAAMAAEKNPRLSALHVNHNLRPAEECEADEQFVRNLCGRLGVPCTVETVPRGTISSWAREHNSGIEAAARHFRHKALRCEAEKRGAAFILIAHTKDDALETSLMRFLRGAGPRGLALLSIFSDAPVGKTGAVKIFRPLLDVTRQDVLFYLKSEGLSYQTDSTNFDNNYLRNKLRHHLLPVLDKYFPCWREGVLETARIQRGAADFLDEALLNVRLEIGESRTVIYDFDSLPPILREEAFFAAFDRENRGKGALRRAVVRDFAHNKSAKAVCAGGGVRAERKRGAVIIKNTLKEAQNEK